MRQCKIKIKGTYDEEKEFTLELTRDSVIWAESMGFNFEDLLGSKPLTNFQILWASSFAANHSDVNMNLAIKLMESYEKEGGDLGEVTKFLIEEYQAFIRALTDTKSKKKKTATIIEK